MPPTSPHKEPPGPKAPAIPSFASLRSQTRHSAVDLLVGGPDRISRGATPAAAPAAPPVRHCPGRHSPRHGRPSTATCSATASGWRVPRWAHRVACCPGCGRPPAAETVLDRVGVPVAVLVLRAVLT